MIESGYIREADAHPNPVAVRWWFYTEIRGRPFARGGRCATAREARNHLRLARDEAHADAALTEELERPSFDLLEDGSLRQIPRDRGIGTVLPTR